MNKWILPLSLLVMCASIVRADGEDDLAAIRQTAMDYMAAWYRGDADTMKACLHKKLAKRSLRGFFGEPDLRHTSASDMVRYTINGYGLNLWPEGGRIEVTILDHFKQIASVRVTSPNYYEYLHLAKIEGRWVIVNALYEPNGSTADR